MRTVRSVVRVLAALAAVFLTVPGLVLSIPSAPASAAELQPPSSGTDAAASHTLALSVTGMTPQYAVRDSTVRLSGTLANRTGAAVSGISVQAVTSTANFSSRFEMTSFTGSGSFPYSLVDAGTSFATGSVPDGTTVHWSVSFPARMFYGTFGVYPVRVRAVTADGGYAADVRTLLPYWPDSGQPEKLRTAWVWPLADSPQQGACKQTLSTGLDSSVSSGGELSTLLGAGAAWARRDHLTWDVDPALLSDVSVMTRPYFTGGNALCSRRFRQEASPAAATWLATLRTASAGQPAFLTPYADVDAAALSHAGLDKDLRSAYQLGESVAGRLLPGTFGTDGRGAGDPAVLRAAYPAAGQADAGVLTSLVDDGGISTAVLSSGEMSSASGFDDALGRTTSGIGTRVSVLLADSGLTSLLGTASASPTQAGRFAFTQDFLAETAMIASEAPSLARSLVIAPPTDWHPSAAEAETLLSATSHAPWLRAAGLSALAAEAAKVPSKSLPAKKASPHELSAGYLDDVKQVDADAALYTNLLYQPPASVLTSLQAAVAATESSAWRGAGSARGRRATGNLLRYLPYTEQKVQIIASRKILLAGNSGETPVSVKNGLGLAVQVQVTASTPAGSQVRVEPHDGLHVVLPGNTITVRMPVHAASIGTSTVQLQLVTQNGSPLTWTVKSLSVEVTRVGRFLLTVIGGALGILVLTSAYRLRRKQIASTRKRGTADDTANAGGAG